MRPVPWSENDAESAWFLAIVPPEPVAASIVREQHRFGIETTVPPHVTVKAQPGLGQPSLWREPLRDRLALVDGFEMRLGPTRWFGEEILYLAVSSPVVVDLHHRILDCLEQAGVEERFEYEADDYVPHLTIGAPWAAPAGNGLAEVASSVEQLDLGPFLVTEIYEFHRAAPDEPYLLYDAVPLRQALTDPSRDRHC